MPIPWVNACSRAVFLAVAACWAAGCSGGAPTAAADPAENVAVQQLQEAGLLLRAYEEQHGRPARSLRDLAPLENAYPAGYAALRSGDVLARWGQSVVGADGTVPVACEKAGPASGGRAVRADGRIGSFSAGELAGFASPTP